MTEQEDVPLEVANVLVEKADAVVEEAIGEEPIVFVVVEEAIEERVLSLFLRELDRDIDS